MKDKKKVVVIRNSCVTGQPVWVYRGPSSGAGRVAYLRDKRAELARAKQARQIREERRRNILRFANECSAGLSVTGDLSDEQRAGLKMLHRIANEVIPEDTAFLDHTVEEDRRREETRRIHKEMREREKAASDKTTL